MVPGKLWIFFVNNVKLVWIHKALWWKSVFLGSLKIHFQLGSWNHITTEGNKSPCHCPCHYLIAFLWTSLVPSLNSLSVSLSSSLFLLKLYNNTILYYSKKCFSSFNKMNTTVNKLNKMYPNK